jgi:hypothetical protein
MLIAPPTPYEPSAVEDENAVTVGNTVSTVTERLDEVEVTVELVRIVVDTAVIAFVPLVSTPVSHVHAPDVALAVHVLPEATPSTYSCTVEPTGAEPVNVSVVVDVMLSLFNAPESSAESRSGVEMLGSA